MLTLEDNWIFIQYLGFVGCLWSLGKDLLTIHIIGCAYEGWHFNSGNYLFTTDTK